MGKASRRKKEKKAHALPEPIASHRPEVSLEQSAQIPVEVAPMAPAKPVRQVNFQIRSNQSVKHAKKIYRILSSAEYADSFTKGEIRISTLETCRNYEDALQGDRGEGTARYHSKNYSKVDWDHSGFQQDALRSGIYIGPGVTDITFHNNTSVTTLPDALVLCTTLEYDPSKLSDTFGNYCVEIYNVEGFFTTLTRALVQRYPIERFYAGRVQYIGREFHGVAPPTHIGFIKPPDPYEPQQEFRMLWTVRRSMSLTPGNITVPELARFCKRIA